ncbi:hypothetical protein D3C73_1244150 [compost metagenome]
MRPGAVNEDDGREGAVPFWQSERARKSHGPFAYGDFLLGVCVGIVVSRFLIQGWCDGIGKEIIDLSLSVHS